MSSLLARPLGRRAVPPVVNPLLALSRPLYLSQGLPLPEGLCCKTLFGGWVSNSPGRRHDDQITMWGTTSSCVKLTGDSGSGFEAASIGGSRLLRTLARNWPLRLFRVLQHYRRQSGHPVAVAGGLGWRSRDADLPPFEVSISCQQCDSSL